MSVCAIAIMGILFLSETWAFASSRIATSITIDETSHPQIRLNFNVTFLDLHCDFVSVDVWDALGTNRQNISKNVDKWQLDDAGQKRLFSGRNRETREVAHETHDQTLEQLHAEGGGVHAIDLTKDTFGEFLDHNVMAFVDYFAPWCVWCQRLAPTWEKLAQEVKKKGMPVGVGKVDCIAEADLCREQRIMAFPTLRWYHAGEPVAPDYKMDRTVDALFQFAKRKLEMDEKFKAWEEKVPEADDAEREKKRLLFQQHRPEHPGCQVSGHLMVNRVPGNFHIEAKSKNFNLNGAFCALRAFVRASIRHSRGAGLRCPSRKLTPFLSLFLSYPFLLLRAQYLITAAMTNLSHIVNHLSFGDPIDENNRRTKRILKQVPVEHRQFAPMDGNTYITKEFHQAHHHYIKVVSTHLNMGASIANSMSAYQFLEQSQVVLYNPDSVPEARFSYDLSPMSVVVEKEGRKWYDYLTSLCAIIGGTFTTLGLIDATLYKILKPKKL